jgi:hypothetical protein
MSSWLGLMNTDSSPGSLKSVCAASSVALASGPSPSAAKAADAIAHRVNFPGRHDGRYGPHAVADSEAQIVVHAEAAIGRRGILPGNHEHAVSAPDQIIDHRVGRRQVEHVVLHDPRRDDEHGLGKNRGSGGGILDQLHQLVAHDDFAGGRRQVATHDESLHAARTLSLERALDILQPVTEASHQVLSGFGPGRVQQLGVAQEIIGR